MPIEAFRKLLELERTLRAPGGCPWDARQTIESLKPNFLEEVHECLEAHSQGDPAEFREELGDVLYVLLFLAVVAEEDGLFTVRELIQGAHDKIYRRHPHVFGEEHAADAEDAVRVWEQVKIREGKKKRESILDGVPAQLPALLRARRVQERASALGFDWEDPRDVVAKVAEEVEEVREAVEAGAQDDAATELGDLLFAIVNLLRFLDRNPEEILVGAIHKFERRFRVVEKAVRAEKRQLSLAEMDRVWERAKRREVEEGGDPTSSP